MFDTSRGALGMVAAGAACAVLAGCVFDWDAAGKRPDAGGGAGGGGAGGGGAGGGGEVAPACPPAVPEPASDCRLEGLTCEYLDDPRPACRITVVCTAAGWDVPSACACEEPVACPEPIRPFSTECPTTHEMCSRPDGNVCSCDQGVWVCPEAATDCPVAAGNTGQPCATDGLSCVYGECHFGTRMERRCKDGLWQDVPIDCTNDTITCG